MQDKSITRANLLIGLVVALGLVVAVSSIPVQAQESLDTSVTVLSSPANSGHDYLKAWDSTISSLGTEQSLLSPGWMLPEQDSAFRLSQPVGLGVDFDAGIYKYRAGPLLDTGRKEYFLGLSYRAFDGGVWYTNDEMLDDRVARVEAGWTHAVGSDLSFSLRMGRTDYGSSRELTDSTNLSLGAQKKLGNVGFGVRLIDQGLMDTPQGNRLHLFGTLTADFD